MLTEKDKLLKKFLKMHQPSFEEKINQYVIDSLEDINNKSALEVIKCGKGPSTGYVDGVQYHKDHQRVTNGEAKVGNLEQKHLDKQLKMSVGGTDWETRTIVEQVDKLVNEYPEDLVGTAIHEDMWESPNMTETGAEYDEVMAWDDAYMGGTSYDGMSSLEDAYEKFEGQMQNAPTLDDNVMMYTHDIPNPELEEGDVFELDTYMGVNFKKGMIGKQDNMLEEVDISTVRQNNYPSRDDTFYDGKSNKSTPYEVTVLGSEGTPLLMTDPYKSSTQPNTHTGVLNKGQKVRLVRVNHDKKTAIYQTVDG